MANQVFDVVRTAIAVREYQDKPVPGDLVSRVVEAGRLTASAANRQPWHFVVVRERENLRALGSLVRTGAIYRDCCLRNRGRLREREPLRCFGRKPRDSVDDPGGLG